jgi:2-phosphoglycerate kinase
MTYLIGGTPRAGKSTIKKLFLERHRIPGITTDLLRESFEYGIPEFGIKDGMENMQKSELLWPYLKGTILARDEFSDDLLIEGTNFLPKYLAQFINKENLKICFIGYCNIAVQEKFKNIRNNFSYDDEWTMDLTDEELLNEIKSFIEMSKYYKAECEQYNIKFFDTSLDFNSEIENVIKYMLSSE